MKIYVNLDNQPPTLATSLSVRSSTASSALLPYTLSGSVSSFEFKRGTTVPLEIVLAGTNVPAASEISALRFALKPNAQFDTAISASADASIPGTLNDDGTLSFSASLSVSSAAIDDALAVNSVVSDDEASANFNAEISWENTAGETTATKTYTAKISNNIYRDGDASAASLPSANWAAVMVVFITWADFCALESPRDDVFYYITDKDTANFDADISTAISAHDNSTSAHATLFNAVNEQIATLQTSVETLNTTLSETSDAVETANANAETALTSATSALSKTVEEATARDDADTALQTQITANATNLDILKTLSLASEAVATTTAAAATSTNTLRAVLFHAGFARDGVLVSVAFPVPSGATQTKKVYLFLQQSATGTWNAKDWETKGVSTNALAAADYKGSTATWTFSGVKIESGKAIRLCACEDAAVESTTKTNALNFFFETSDDSCGILYDGSFYSGRHCLATLNYLTPAVKKSDFEALEARVAALESAGTSTDSTSA